MGITLLARGMVWKDSYWRTSRCEAVATRRQRHSRMGSVSKHTHWYLLQFWKCFLYDFFCLLCGDFYFFNWENFILNYRKFIKSVLKYFLFQMTRSWIKSYSEVLFTALGERAKTTQTTWGSLALYLLGGVFFKLVTDWGTLYVLSL